ncbi:biotin-dependent carboxyltransferase family protein [Microbacterium sp. NPDC056044]|uniref:5-oxoprolinase subunit C family protein n=1 Tax=Microbacterium sp. NPDC056044 TaxID=3345690 RepID=UPI0035DBBBFD
MTETRLLFSEVGWRTTVQDLGRTATERLGVPRGGAADQGAARTANILVGNPQGAPLIESLGGAVEFAASTDVLVSATGSVGNVEMDGCRVEGRQPLALPAGATFRVETAESAARSYIAIGGLIETRRFLGSAAPDPRMGFAQALTAGASLDLRTAVTTIRQPHLGRALFRLPVPTPASEDHDWVVEIVDCAETDDVPGIRELLAESTYTVNNRSDHVGIRLDGPVLHPSHVGEILSHGVPIGAIEIPHSDELIVLGRYRTLTAGYPIVGFATRRSQDLVGQVRPGRALQFRWVDRAVGRARALSFEADLAVLQAAAMSAFASLELPVAATRSLHSLGSNATVVSYENAI